MKPKCCVSCLRKKLESEYAEAFSKLNFLCGSNRSGERWCNSSSSSSSSSPSSSTFSSFSPSLYSSSSSSSSSSYSNGAKGRFAQRLVWCFVMFASIVEATAWSMSGTQPFGKALGEVVIEIPYLSVEEGGENLTMTGVVCDDIGFNEVNLTAKQGKPPDFQIGSPKTSFQLGNVTGLIDGVRLTCAGNFTLVPVSAGIKAHGLVYFQLVGTGLELTMGIGINSGWKSFQANSSGCQSQLGLDNLTFIGAPVLERLAAKAEAAINALAPGAICSELDNLININLTYTLNSVMADRVDPALDYLEEYESSPKFGRDQCIVASTLAGGIWLMYVLILITIKTVRAQRAKKIEHAMDLNDKTPLLGSGTAPDESPNSPTYSHALSLSPKIHILWAIFVPFALLCNIALFLTSNLSVGASVYVALSLGTPPGTPTQQLPSLFSFTLANSVKDMWDAGVYPLSILIACFSGIWPYVKLILMLLCWWLPVRLLPVRRRERVLIALDALGKWSLVDSYVLVLMVVAFRLKMPFEFFTVNIFVQSNVGFYTFLIATIMSLILTHFTLALHRKAEEPEYPEFADRIEPAESIGQHVFGLGWDVFCKCSVLGSGIIVATLIISAIMLGAGASVDTFAFEFGGLVGGILKFLHDSTVRTYSIISLAMSLPGSTFYDPTQLGIHAIQACFITWTFAMPLAHITAMLVLWLVPMKPRFQQHFFHMTEIFNAWSALEVFVASILAALLELEQFAVFIVGHKCDTIDEIYGKLFHLDNPSCFEVKASLQWGCGILFTAAVLYFIVSTFAMRLTHKAIRERLENAYLLHADLTDIGNLQDDKRIEIERRLDNERKPSHWNNCWRTTTINCSLSLAPLHILTIQPPPSKEVPV